ncbi:MAG: cyclopropane-fatty-acyl-phospholipid synthase family protein [Planctomycetota bacterium]|nr:cyclopropane-fatty-acyl-phospholipid synthase family protein [Planctomycetota bacterium]
MRRAIRNLCRKRILREQRNQEKGISRIESAEIAVETEAANEQHYEVPAEFYALVLGHHRKYSCGWWETDTNNLDQSEELALSRTVRNAHIEDGMSILDLGCGWGALTLYLARQFPNCSITSVSNSHSQRIFIEQQLKQRALENHVQVITRNINSFEPTKRFDRIVSIEMFEHIRNHDRLFQNLSNWLKPDGEILTHVFAHHKFSYNFDITSSHDWMARYFFTGGMMPNHQTLPKAAQLFQLREQDVWSGIHYQKTALSWLDKMDGNQSSIMEIFSQCYPGKARVWWNRWRIFFMAVAELFGFHQGNEWGIVQQRFSQSNPK